MEEQHSAELFNLCLFFVIRFGFALWHYMSHTFVFAIGFQFILPSIDSSPTICICESCVLHRV